MKTIFNYRKEILHINSFLEHVVCDLYTYGFNIGRHIDRELLLRCSKTGRLTDQDLKLLHVTDDPVIRQVVGIIGEIEQVLDGLMRNNLLTEQEMDNAHMNHHRRVRPEYVPVIYDDYWNWQKAIFNYLRKIAYQLCLLSIQLGGSDNGWRPDDGNLNLIECTLMNLRDSDPNVKLMICFLSNLQDHLKILLRIYFTY